jgi:hypothetical protein
MQGLESKGNSILRCYFRPTFSISKITSSAILGNFGRETYLLGY